MSKQQIMEEFIYYCKQFLFRKTEVGKNKQNRLSHTSFTKPQQPWEEYCVGILFSNLIKVIIYNPALIILYQQGQFHYQPHQPDVASRDILKELFGFALK